MDVCQVEMNWVGLEKDTSSITIQNMKTSQKYAPWVVMINTFLGLLAKIKSKNDQSNSIS